ncbi:ABC transporter substrate-binding protein [Psychrobacter lutiphocae]|uniref:ABC transporter substrate-binding protein n=1 Tax=Psychrobacter lutiphocae TaxID=540500 RepID=UPI001D12C5F6|nr:ABC transporter substrate-binding protein [Psychrobacter lutiphocae]
MSYAAYFVHYLIRQLSALQKLRQIGTSANTTFCLLIMVSVGSMGVLSACSSSDDSEAHDANLDAALIQERFQVATDLNLEQMRKLGDVYSQESGVLIDWVAMDKQVFTVRFDEEPPLVFDIELPNNTDMVLMHSAYTLANAKASHVLQPLGSEVLNTRIPKQYQDEEGYWYGVGMYGRTLVYNHNKVNEPELINYAGLASKKWQGRLCMTDVFSAENQAITKMMWTYRGSKLTPEIVANWQANMGKASASNEDVLTKIDQGLCDVGVVDSDAFWQYAKTNPNTSVRLMWANQINRGTMTNTISIGMLDSGKQVGHALRFMEWLVSDEGQALLAFYTSTFPVVTIKDVSIDMAVTRPEWTQFDADNTLLSEIIADHRKIEPDEPIEPNRSIATDFE